MSRSAACPAVRCRLVTADRRAAWATRPILRRGAWRVQANFAQKHDVELVKQMVRPDVELRVREQVNQAIEKELQNLKEAYERDLKAKKSKGAKKGKGKKGKSAPPRDAPTRDYQVSRGSPEAHSSWWAAPAQKAKREKRVRRARRGQKIQRRTSQLSSCTGSW